MFIKKSIHNQRSLHYLPYITPLVNCIDLWFNMAGFRCLLFLVGSFYWLKRQVQTCARISVGYESRSLIVRRFNKSFTSIVVLYVHYKLFYKIRVDNFNFSSENSYPILNRFCTDVSSAVLERGRVVIGRLEIYQTQIVKLPNNRTHMHVPTSSLPVEWTITGYRRMYMLHTYGRKTLTVLQICLNVHK